MADDRPTVLVIDDDPAVRRVLGAMLENQGFTAVLAGSGADGVAAYARHRGQIAAVVIDVQMPEKDGPQTLAELRALDSDVPCVFVTGFSPHHPLWELEGRGAVVLTKPFGPHELGRAVREATGRA